MLTTMFEDTYTCITNAKNTTANLINDFIVFMEKDDNVRTCKEWAKMFFGYVDGDYREQSYVAKVAQMIKHAKSINIIRTETTCKTILVEKTVSYITDFNTKPMIKLNGEDGQEYWIKNPAYENMFKQYLSQHKKTRYDYNWAKFTFSVSKPTFTNKYGYRNADEG